MTFKSKRSKSILDNISFCPNFDAKARIIDDHQASQLIRIKPTNPLAIADYTSFDAARNSHI